MLSSFTVDGPKNDQVGLVRVGGLINTPIWMAWDIVIREWICDTHCITQPMSYAQTSNIGINKGWVISLFDISFIL